MVFNNRDMELFFHSPILRKASQDLRVGRRPHPLSIEKIQCPGMKNGVHTVFITQGLTRIVRVIFGWRKEAVWTRCGEKRSGNSPYENDVGGR